MPPLVCCPHAKPLRCSLLPTFCRRLHLRERLMIAQDPPPDEPVHRRDSNNTERFDIFLLRCRRSTPALAMGGCGERKAPQANRRGATEGGNVESLGQAHITQGRAPEPLAKDHVICDWRRPARVPARVGVEATWGMAAVKGGQVRIGPTKKICEEGLVDQFFSKFGRVRPDPGGLSGQRQ